MDDLSDLLAAATESSEPAGVREQAESLMRKHGLQPGEPGGWTLQFDNAKQRAGECRRRDRVISLSAPLMSRWTEEQRKDTILHEIAHALAPANSGHGLNWQRICLEIGADPTRTWGHNGEERIEQQRWTGTCPQGHEYKRDRLSTRIRERSSCPRCGGGYYNPDHKLTWERTG